MYKKNERKTTQEYNIGELNRAIRSGRQDERYGIIHLLNKEIHEAHMHGESTLRLNKIRDEIKKRTD